VDGGEIAHAQPPEHAVDQSARLPGNRAVSLAVDDEPPARERRDPERLRIPATHAHERAAHVRSIGEMQRHAARMSISAFTRVFDALWKSGYRFSDKDMRKKLLTRIPVSPRRPPGCRPSWRGSSSPRRRARRATRSPSS